MTLDEQRRARAAEAPVVSYLPGFPGILAAMGLSSAIGVHLRGLAEALLVEEFPDLTINRGERELLATAVSASNGCFFCMDSHGAFAAELLSRAGQHESRTVVEAVKQGSYDKCSGKIAALISIARQVATDPRQLKIADVADAKSAGASEGDIQLTILVAAAFCMYNRMVDGLRAKTPADPEFYTTRAPQVAEFGYKTAALEI